jgi:hypothetical protein
VSVFPKRAKVVRDDKIELICRPIVVLRVDTPYETVVDNELIPGPAKPAVERYPNVPRPIILLVRLKVDIYPDVPRPTIVLSSDER